MRQCSFEIDVLNLEVLSNEDIEHLLLLKANLNQILARRYNFTFTDLLVSYRMGSPKVTNSLNKTLHLTGIGLAVQAFYINLTLDSVLGGEYLQLAPAGPPVINPASVWGINGVPMAYGYNQGGLNTGTQGIGTLGTIGGQNHDANAFRDQNGYYLGNAGLRNGYDTGKTYGGKR